MRRGFVRISDTLYRGNWDNIYPLFKDFRPTYIEFRHWEDDVWYIYGVSRFFRVLKEGETTPEYTCEILHNQDGTDSCTFKTQ